MSKSYQRGPLTFNVLEFGGKNKETIILLHGFPANAQSWKPTAELLAKKGYYVLVPENEYMVKPRLHEAQPTESLRRNKASLSKGQRPSSSSR